MALSVRSVGAAPPAIAGGFVLVPAREIFAAWHACRRRPLGVADFRTWLACREMVARRCTLGPGRGPRYGPEELAALTGVAPRRARASVGRLARAGLLTWSEDAIGFPPGGGEPGGAPGPDLALADTIAGPDGNLFLPRRFLRFLAGGARPALIAAGIAVLLRCLARGRSGFRPRGRVKASWIADAFGVDLRRAKQARKELVELGWIAPEDEEGGRRAENRWGRAYRIDLGWGRRSPAAAGSRLPPPPAVAGARLPPPDLYPEPLRERRTPEPAPGGPAGIEIDPERRGRSSGATSPTSRAPALPGAVAASPPPARGRASTGPRPPGTSAGPSPSPRPRPRLDDVRPEDLAETPRLLELLRQAIARGLLGAGEADRLRFVAAAEHARAAGRVNPCGLFAHLVRGRHWDRLGQADEDRARVRLRRELRGPSRPGPGGPPGGLGLPVPSPDARLVLEVRRAMIRVGVFRDPYPAFARVTPGWTRERWDRALCELGLSRGGS